MGDSTASDSELLADWLQHRRDSAFHALVVRYAPLVHLAAKRTCGDEALAADASQLVFILLAQKAKSLASRTSLAGWLHRAAILHAKQLTAKSRRENRKRQLLQVAMETEPPHASNNILREMQPILDEAIAALSEKDREAILLRFYRSLSIREIAATLGIATDAAQKRLDRATERLRAKLARRGCQAGGSLSAVMLAGFAADAQAATLSVSVITSKAVAASTVGTTLNTVLATITAIKATSLLLPALTLSLAGAWLGSQYLSISSLESESAVLQNAIAASDSSSKADVRPAKLINSTKAKQDNEPLDWKKIAAQIAAGGDFDDIGDVASMMKLEQRLQAMSKEELVAALDEIAALDLPKKSRHILEQMLIDPLVQKDPQLALSKFIDRIQHNDGSINYYLTEAMQRWARIDPSSAISWFDQQIAAGKFDSKTLDGKNEARLEFERSFMGHLLDSDPEAAGRRLSALPEDQRDEALSEMSSLKEENQAAFAKLVRDQIPEKDQARTLALQASSLVRNDGNYSKVTEFLDGIQATPTERTACVEEAAESKLQNIADQKKVTRDDLDSMRKWLTAQAPEKTDALTGTVLAYATLRSRNMKFSELADLAVEYNSAAGNDEVLSSFLGNCEAQDNKEQARILAERISDPKRREQILKKLK